MHASSGASKKTQLKEELHIDWHTFLLLGHNATELGSLQIIMACLCRRGLKSMSRASRNAGVRLHSYGLYHYAPPPPPHRPQCWLALEASPLARWVSQQRTAHTAKRTSTKLGRNGTELGCPRIVIAEASDYAQPRISAQRAQLLEDGETRPNLRCFLIYGILTQLNSAEQEVSLMWGMPQSMAMSTAMGLPKIHKCLTKGPWSACLPRAFYI